MSARLFAALFFPLTTLAVASGNNESASMDSTLSDQTLFGHQIPVLNTSDETLHPHPNTDGCAAACAHLLASSSIAVSNPNTTTYTTSRSAYWSSFQSSQSPACFADPATAAEVSLLLTVAKRFACPFAVKSGGHAAFPGASNIASGLVISLDKLRELTLSADRSVTRVGTGNKWIDVYEYLQPRGLSVVGGRVPDIGTGGLVLGGGISFFSGRHGWACDGVRTYEVVVADAVLEVSRESFPDLYWALRGGGNNLGVVTRVDLETFSQGMMWGGATTVVVDEGSRTALITAMEAFARRAPEDVDATAYTAWVWVQAQGAWIAVNELTHAGGVASPEVLKRFTDIPAVSSTLRMAELTDLVQELGKMNVNGLRESFMTHAFKMSAGVIEACLDIFVEEVETIKEVGGILPVLLFQPIPANVIEHFSRDGGNCLGVDADEGPLLLMSTSTWWVDTSQDELVLATMKRVIDRSVQKAKEMGAFHPYIYQNYAGQEQEVFAGYGEKNLERLREIARKYDPEDVFQKLQPGYFKLGESK